MEETPINHLNRFGHFHYVDRLKKTLERYAGEPHVVLDLSETFLVDHTTMTKLHEMEKEFKERQSTLVIAGLEDHTPLSNHTESEGKNQRTDAPVRGARRFIHSG